MNSRHVLGALLCAVAGLLQVACGGAAAEYPAGASDGSQAPSALHAFLYANSRASVEFWADLSDVPEPTGELLGRLATLPAAGPGIRVGLFAIRYPTNNLPQRTLYIRREGNQKLLVYNHGHGGLPAAAETFASDFLAQALAGGHDLLVTSMPLTGLNDPATGDGAGYFMLTRDLAGPAGIAPEVLALPLRHGLYEMLDEADHYLHYFVDGALVPASLLVDRGPGTAYLPLPLQVDAPAYSALDYVGLSGGATTGLVACALMHFDHCILVAGVMPDYLRLIDARNIGDAEQQTRSFHQHFSVPTLMELARARSGQLVMLLNRRDPCCFADPAASRFQLDFPGYDIRLTDLDYHGYVASELQQVLLE